MHAHIAQPDHILLDCDYPSIVSKQNGHVLKCGCHLSILEVEYVHPMSLSLSLCMDQA
jgi:hypothetical protein